MKTAKGKMIAERLTAKEEEIMNHFWERGELFVRELLELYTEPKPHFNTLSTIVRGLEEKGFISHRSFGSTYQYYAAISREEYNSNDIYLSSFDNTKIKKLVITIKK